MKAIDKEPEKRYQGTGEMFSALTGIRLEAADEEEKTRIMSRYEEPAGENKPAASPDRKKIYIGGAALIIVVLIISIYFITGNKEEKIKDGKGSVLIENQKKIIPASLSVNSDPAGAAVFINGKKEGTTPYSLDSLAIARYSIMLKLAGYDDWLDAGYLVDTGKE